MDSRAQRKALFRSKVREASQKRDKRIDSPLVRYNEYDQPVCRVCNVILKSEALWPAHQASRKHHEAIENVKAAAAGVSQDSKIKKDEQVEVHKPRSSSILPEGFFDNQDAKRQKSGISETTVVKLPAGSSSFDVPHKRKEVPHNPGHAVEVAVSSKKANRLANDHLVEREERSENKHSAKLDQPSNKTDYSDGKQIKGVLPESFF
ncbi:zinc finger protein 830 isoform X2 [Iris pallida]|uniref:Zinc finger protein 830 isoform X2 n=1 Tax=Iris pallida TaxID=29817 RepID=A0AAX6EVK3_IRIPA|nr:zinc finger protein 830 isoform X2 [Iris pallida]